MGLGSGVGRLEVGGRETDVDHSALGFYINGVSGAAVVRPLFARLGVKIWEFISRCRRVS